MQKVSAVFLLLKEPRSKPNDGTAGGKLKFVFEREEEGGGVLYNTIFSVWQN